MDAPDSDLEMEDPDLEAAMGFPVTASLGPVGPLLRQLRSLTTVRNVVSEDEIQGLTEHLDGLCVSLMHQSMAEAEQPLSSTAKCWMREVRELCYDTKNYLDDAPFISKQDDDAKLTPEEKQENAQFEFKMLEARAKNASKRRQRYKIDHNSINKQPKLPSTGRRLPVLHPELIDRGRMDKLASMLGNEEGEQLKVVSLVGLEGVGKTTLAKRIYHKTGGQFECGAFVRVSPNPDMRRLLTTIFTQIQSPGFSFYEGVSQPPCCLDAQDLITKIKDYLRDKRYLIIIDDLWSTSVWDIIRRAFPDGGFHSRIITTTQFEDVASACCSYQSNYKFEMEPLNYDQSRKLFFAMVFGFEDKVSFPEGFGEVSSEIIEKCGGLPLSMVNIASLLPTEESEINLQQWKDIRDSLPPTSVGMEKVINLIYNNLSPEVRTCLLYLAVYPEGYTSNKDDLVKQWVTEGFTGEGQNKEVIAREYFDELVSRGMIQPVDINYRGVLSCTLHHMVHGLIVNKSMEGNFVIGVDNFQSLPNKVRRLSVHFSGARSACIPAGIMVSEVRSLAFFGFYGCADFIEKCKLLRVLILHVWADQDKVPFDVSGISKLLPLRYVKIACNIAVKLPAEIEDLQYLETLEMDTPVVAIPSNIGGLRRLSCLKISVRALVRQDIHILQALPTLSALSLHMWTMPVEMVVFYKGEFLVLKCFEFKCRVPWLKFEAGSMPNLRNLNLCFNAREADQHGIVPIGMEQLSGLKEITADIWGSDTDVGSTFRTAISNHPSNPRIYMRLVNPIFHGAATTSVGTIKVEDEKKQAADIRMSKFPRSKRMSTLLGSSSRVPVQGADKKLKLEIKTDGIEVKAETLDLSSSSSSYMLRPRKRTLRCQVCKSSFETLRAGKFASFCDTCLESKGAQNTTSSPKIGRPPKKLSPGTKTTSAGRPTSYGAKTTRAGSPTSYGRVPRNFYPVGKTTSAGSPTSSGRVPKNFSPGAKTTSAGKITRKDNGLHKLVFMSGILPEGTDVGYYVGGKRWLDGYIKELGIYCHCCNTVVSPSQFEGHAGRAAWRKPYHNIYMSNGVSLHELSVSLSKGRKTSERQSDDLCSICSDDGELLLCDTCPRAFHRECVGLSSVPKGTWCCRYCESRQ